MPVKAVVLGAGGFIGHHLVRRLKADGYWVRGVDRKNLGREAGMADEFMVCDLRTRKGASRALFKIGGVDEVYQLAADMGGMGYIPFNECEIMRNNALINIHALYVAAQLGVTRYFFSSSVCVYADLKQSGHPAMGESWADTAQPDNEYGWEKLYAERMALAYAREYNMQVRIGRLQNTYGPECDWSTERAKAPAALCRKVAQAKDGDSIEVWGDGTAVRQYTWIGDTIEEILALTWSTLEGPVNIGTEELCTVDELVQTVIDVSGKDLSIRHIAGPVGVNVRNFSKARMHSIGWRAETDLKEGLSRLYLWVKEQVENACQ